MNMHVLDRSLYDVFFIPYAKDRPKKKTVTDYIEAKFPWYDAECLTDIRTLCQQGNKWVMATVARKTTLGENGLLSKRLITAAHLLLAKDAQAADTKTYSYKNELIRTGKKPDTMLATGESAKNIPAGAIALQDTELAEIQSRLRYIPPLFKSKKPALQVCLGFCAALLFFVSMNQGTVVETADSDTHDSVPTARQVIIEKSRPPFHAVLEAVISACKASGSTIISFEYSNFTNRVFTVSAMDGNPRSAHESLTLPNAFPLTALETLSYSKDRPRYTFTLMDESDLTYEEPLSSLTGLFSETEEVSSWSRHVKIPLVSMTLEKKPRYVFSVPPQMIGSFILSLTKFAFDANKEIAHILIAQECINGPVTLTFALSNVAPELNHSTLANAEPSLSAEDINGCFTRSALVQPFTPREKIADSRENKNAIGRIVESDGNKILFTKAGNGKIQSERSTQ